MRHCGLGPCLALGEGSQEALQAQRQHGLLVTQQLAVELLFAPRQPPHLHEVARPAEHLLDDLQGKRAATDFLLALNEALLIGCGESHRGLRAF